MLLSFPRLDWLFELELTVFCEKVKEDSLVLDEDPSEFEPRMLLSEK